MSARANGGRLICVSNRVGTVRGAPLAGGLAIALSNALRANRGLWFGWSGKTAAEVGAVTLDEAHGIKLATLDLPKADFDAYYAGYSNNVLWPLFHFRIDLVRYDRAQYDAYRRINKLIAQRVAELVRPDDRIWVHDYHLIPLAEELRALGLNNRIGFFLHIPTPPRELMAALPGNRELMGSLLYYDLVGLQTHGDRQRLHDYAQRELECTVTSDGLSAFGRKVRTGAFPVGIDVEEFESFADSAKARQEARRMRRLLDGRTQIIGVDRLDYSKGLLRRAAGFERMLEKYPRVQRSVEFLQVTPISRGEVQAYQDFRTELEALASHINGRFGSFDWTPLRYLNKALPQRTLAALYRASRIGLVTPIRDGMNLVAKEYVAAQDPEDPGVLILSAFAGAAEQMHEALLVNPYDPDEVADALERARTMELAERVQRHRALIAVLRRDSSDHWQSSYLRALDGDTSRSPAIDDGGQPRPTSVRSKRSPASRSGTRREKSAAPGPTPSLPMGAR
jgi:trehalose 6-phosphate synthase